MAACGETALVNLIPDETLNAIVVYFVSDDFVFDFRTFLRPHDPENLKLIELLCLGLIPRYFNEGD